MPTITTPPADLPTPTALPITQVPEATSNDSGYITNWVISDKFKGPAGAAFTNLIKTLWNLSLIVAGLAIFIFLVWGAFEWLTAGSDSDKVSKAQQRIVNSLIGALVLVSVLAILKFFLPFIGLNILCPINWQTLTIKCS